MPTETFVQPSLQDLAARLLAGQIGAHASGLAAFEPNEVTPYEAGPVQPINPETAWREAVVALTYCGVQEVPAAPPHWPHLVANHEPVVALAFCVGNFPQLVRNFHQILQSRELTSLRPVAGRPTLAPQVSAWAEQCAANPEFPKALVALGALRLAKQFDEADRLVAALDSAVPAEWQAAWDNEKAALAWHRGDMLAALTAWRGMSPSLPVRFNMAMAELFSGDAAAARVRLTDVVREMPESSAWHHLARLYLTLATMR